MTYKSKRTSYGLAEVRDSDVSGWYGLYVNGELKEQSSELSYILSAFDRLPS